MNNKTVQECLCTEPKDTPDEALKFVVAFEVGISQQRSFSGEVKNSKTIRYAALTNDPRIHAREVDWSLCKITYPHAWPK